MARKKKPLSENDENAGDLSFPSTDKPHDATRIMMDKRGHMVEPPDNYEFIPLSQSPSPGQPAEAGHMHVPQDNNDLTEEGWTVPTERGGGWEQPADVAPEDRLDEREGEE